MNSIKTKGNSVLFLVSVMIIWLSLFIFYSYYKSVRNKPLSWDEIDYINSAKQGFKANYLEKGSLTISQFLSLSFAKSKQDTAQLKILSAKLPPEESDPFILRHFHPVIPVYYWALFTEHNPVVGANNLHASNLVQSVLIFICILLGLFMYAKKDRTGYPEILLFSSIFFISPIYYASFEFINFHTFHLLACLFYCHGLFIYLKNKNWKAGVYLSAGIALLTLTLDMSWVVLFFTAVLIVAFKKWKGMKFKELAGIILLSALMVILLNPGFLTTGGTFKSIFMHLYRFIFKKGTEYNGVSTFGMWAEIMSENLFLFIFLVAGLVLILMNRKKIDSNLLLIYSLGLLYVLFMSPLMISKTYVLPGIGIITFSTIIIFLHILQGRTKKNIQLIIPGLLLLAAAATCFFGNNSERTKTTNEEHARFYSDIDRIKKELELKPAEINYANDFHVLNYYLDTDIFSKLLLPVANTVNFKARSGYVDKDIKDEVLLKKTSRLILLKRFGYSDSSLAYLKNAGYSLTELNNYILANK